MATKKQKRLAGEARQAERDAAHEAEIQWRIQAARKRAKRRAQRQAEQERRAQNIKAARRIHGAAAKEGE